MNADSIVEHAFVIGHLLALASPVIVVAGGLLWRRRRKILAIAAEAAAKAELG